MKTDAPGPWRCETYLKCWIFGIRDGLVRDHIDNCRFCKPIVYGDGKLFMTSLDEDIAQRVAERKARTRRRLRRALIVTGAAVVLAAVLLPFERGATRNGVPDSIDSDWSQAFTIVKRRYDDRGREGVVAMAMASEDDAILVLKWIVAEQQVQLYDLPFAFLGDSRQRVKRFALSRIAAMHPADADNYKAQLASAAASETDPQIRAVMLEVLRQIENG